MGLRGVPIRGVSAAFAAVLGIAAASLAACATPGSYAGISYRSDSIDADLRMLARRAQAGDKAAQLELGIRFEQGLGLPRDLRRAARLYRLAAADSARFTYIYSPGPGQGQLGQTLALRRAPELGLLEAKQRLARLLSRTEGGGDMSK